MTFRSIFYQAAQNAAFFGSLFAQNLFKFKLTNAQILCKKSCQRGNILGGKDASASLFLDNGREEGRKRRGKAAPQPSPQTRAHTAEAYGRMP